MFWGLYCPLCVAKCTVLKIDLDVICTTKHTNKFKIGGLA